MEVVTPTPKQSTSPRMEQKCNTCEKVKPMTHFKTKKRQFKICRGCRSDLQKRIQGKRSAARKTSSNGTKPMGDIPKLLSLLDKEGIPLTLDIIKRATGIRQDVILKYMAFFEKTDILIPTTHNLGGYSLKVWSRSENYKIFKEIVL